MSNGITSRETSYSVRGVYRFDSILSLSFLFLSLSPILVRPTNRPKGYKRTDPCVSPLFPLIFSPSLSLSFSLSQCPPSSSFHPASLSPLFFYVQRERERGKILLFLEEERKKLLSFLLPSLLLPERKKRKRFDGESSGGTPPPRGTKESKERFRGLNPGCNKVHQARYLATVIGLRCHESYVIILCGTWEAAVRGFPDWRGEREREIGLLKLFSLSVFAARASFA